MNIFSLKLIYSAVFVSLFINNGNAAAGYLISTATIRDKTLETSGGIIGTRPTPVGTCIQKRLKHVGADPSKLMFFIDGINQVYSVGSTQIGNIPPAGITIIAQSTIVDLGFSVDPDARESSTIDNSFYLRVALIGFTPLSDSETNKNDFDVVFLDGGKSSSFHVGSITTNGTIYHKNPDGRWISIGTENVKVPFFMEKSNGDLNVGLKIGTSAGRGYERVSVSSVGDATELAVRLAGEAIISKTFGFDCF